MKPRKEVLNNTERKEERRSRFQIVKLEERIAPRRNCYYGCYPHNSCHYNPHGKLVGHC
jgi:hypothetical protein